MFSLVPVFSLSILMSDLSSSSSASSSNELSPMKQLGRVTRTGMFDMIEATFNYQSTFSNFSREGLVS